MGALLPQHVVGLFKSPPELNVCVPSLVQRTLENLEQILTDTERLKKDYGLDLKVTEEEVKEIHGGRRAFGQLINKTKPQFINDTARVYSRRNNAWRKIMWGSIDAERLRLLLDDIHYFNDQLRSVMYPADQQATSTDQDQVMRFAVSQSPDKGTLDSMSGPLDSVDSAIAASARLRQRGLMLDVIPTLPTPNSGAAHSNLRNPSQSSSSRKPSSYTGKKDMRKSTDQLSNYKGHLSIEVLREVALLDGKSVVVEWKDVEGPVEPKFKYRIANVAAFLADMHYPTFHSLSCAGYFKSPTGRYAYLFEPPPEASSTFTMYSLKQLLEPPAVHPSLNDRITIALALAGTVLQLHTAGLLHKGIRPENVLYFERGSEQWERDDPFSTYLGGYDFARADNPLETTEAPSARKLTELYRHPESLGSGRVSYNKQFDLYSLGCVLIELVFWEPLPAILWRKLRQTTLKHDALVANGHINELQSEATRERLMLQHRHSLLSATDIHSIAAGLRSRSGDAYYNIVKECLHATQESSSDDDEEYHGSVETQEASVATLRSLHGVL